MSQHRKRIRDPLRHTLTELEEDEWGPPAFNSPLVQSVHRLRHVPLKDLTPGDLRLMIGQDIGLRYLVPVALDLLDADPFIDGSCYPGDLLKAVIGIPSEFWLRYTAMADSALEVAWTAIAMNETVEGRPELKSELQRFIDSRHKSK